MKLKKTILLLFFIFMQASFAHVQNDKKDAHNVMFETVVYFYPGHTDSKKDFSEYFPNFTILKKMPNKTVEKASLNIKYVDVSEKNYSVVNVEYLSYFGRGLTKKQALDIQNSKKALVISTIYPIEETGKNHYQAVKDSHKGALLIAKENRGLIWDSETRELMSPEEWQIRRIASWENGMPAMSRHTVIHAYNNGSWTRAITLGMAKFGLPDIVVNDFSWDLNRQMGDLVLLATQVMVEKQLPDVSNIRIDVNALLPSQYKEITMKKIKYFGDDKKIINLRIGEAKKEDGDPDNHLLEILFDDIKADTLQQRQEKLVTSIFGQGNGVRQIKHQKPILEASKRAKIELEELRKVFDSGLAPQETISVKTPFKTDSGGNEWMWVKISEWKNKKITGLLQNQPVNVSNLKGGEMVEVNQDDVFDYYYLLPDGTEIGNETGKLIEKMSK